MTSEQLQDVQDHAGYFFTSSEIATILGLSEKETKTAEFVAAYQKGKLITEASIRKSIIDLAASGSSPAQILALKFIEQSKIDEIE